MSDDHRSDDEKWREVAVFRLTDAAPFKFIACVSRVVVNWNDACVHLVKQTSSAAADKRAAIKQHVLGVECQRRVDAEKKR